MYSMLTNVFEHLSPWKDQLSIILTTIVKRTNIATEGNFYASGGSAFLVIKHATDKSLKKHKHEVLEHLGGHSFFHTSIRPKPLTIIPYSE